MQLGEAHKGLLADQGVPCDTCKESIAKLQVLESAAGFYIGRFCKCGPCSRESDYFRERKAAEEVLRGPLYGRRVTVTYFKPSGKYYTEDNGVLWPRDPDHYNGWADFKKVVRLKSMIGICMDSPLGFPQLVLPQE